MCAHVTFLQVVKPWRLQQPQLPFSAPLCAAQPAEPKRPCSATATRPPPSPRPTTPLTPTTTPHRPRHSSQLRPHRPPRRTPRCRTARPATQLHALALHAALLPADVILPCESGMAVNQPRLAPRAPPPALHGPRPERREARPTPATPTLGQTPRQPPPSNIQQASSPPAACQNVSPTFLSGFPLRSRVTPRL